MEWFKILGPTLLVILGGIISWTIQTRVQKLNILKEELRKERIKKYNEIIYPIVVMYSQRGGGAEKASKIVTSIDYRKAAFDLNFWSSDSVISSYNNLMQFIYKREKRENKLSDTKDLLNLLGILLLDIRKDVGNDKTSLKSIDMLRSMISDIDSFPAV